RARALEKRMPLLAIEPAKRLVEDHEPRVPTDEGASETNTLAFATGHERAALAEDGLQTVRQHLENRREIRGVDDRRIRLGGLEGAVAEAVEHRATPDLHG